MSVPEKTSPFAPDLLAGKRVLITAASRPGSVHVQTTVDVRAATGSTPRWAASGTSTGR